MPRRSRPPDPAAATIVEEIAAGIGQRDGGRGKPAAVRRGLAHQIEQLVAGFGPHDGFVGCAQRREHARQALLLTFGPRLLVGPVEGPDRERHVVGEPLQQFGEFGRERVLLGGNEEHHADRLAGDQQRKRRARHRAVAVNELVKRRPARVSAQIIGNAGPARAECVAAQPAPFRMIRVGRNLHPAHVVGRRPRHGHHIGIVAVGSGQENAGRVEPAALCGSFAHQLEQLRPRRCTNDRFVGRAERRQHAPQTFLLGVGSGLFAGAIEIIQRERDVLRDPRHQGDDLFVLRPQFSDKEQQHADALVGLDQRNGDAGGDAGLACGLMPGLPLGRVEDVVIDGRLLRSERPAADARSIRVAGIDRERRPHDLLDDRAGPGNRLQPDRVRLRKQDHGSRGFSAVYRGIANPLIEILFGLGAQNGFVGRADGAEHPVQPPHHTLAVLARGLMVEIVERKRNVCRHALQHRDDLPVDRVRLAPRNEQHADALAVAGQRQRCRRAHLIGLGPIAPGQRARIVQEIVADAYFPVAESVPGNPGPLGRTGHDRDVDAAQARNVVTTAGGEAQEIGFRLQQEDRHGQEVADRERGFADLRVQFCG